MAISLMWAVGGGFVCSVFAAASSAAFDRANQLYEEGKFDQAALAYRQLLERNEISAAVRFNLGNALFKGGKIGEAIVQYRLAERLAPRDPDIRANLKFARDSLPGGVGAVGRWQRWLGFVTLNELAWITAGTFWVLLGIMTVRQLRPAWRTGSRFYVVVAALAWVVSLTALGFAAYERLARPQAVVIAKAASLRYGPVSESPAAFSVQSGAEFVVLDEKAGWLQVSDGGHRAGWIEKTNVVVLTPG